MPPSKRRSRAALVYEGRCSTKPIDVHPPGCYAFWLEDCNDREMKGAFRAFNRHNASLRGGPRRRAERLIESNGVG